MQSYSGVQARDEEFFAQKAKVVGKGPCHQNSRYQGEEIGAPRILFW